MVTVYHPDGTDVICTHYCALGNQPRELHPVGPNGPLLFGKVKIWGEIAEHEAGYRSQFGKIVSLDYGDLELLEKFRKIYRVNQVSAEPSASKPER